MIALDSAINDLLRARNFAEASSSTGDQSTRFDPQCLINAVNSRSPDESPHPIALLLPNSLACCYEFDRISHIQPGVLRKAIRSCIEYGCFANAAAICDLYEHALSPSEQRDYFGDRLLPLWRARVLRGQNMFSDAITIYADLAIADRERGDEQMCAYELMSIGKTLDNHEWRIGLAHILLTKARASLERIIRDRGPSADVQRYLSIAIDSICGLTNKVSPLSFAPGRGVSDGSAVLVEWDNAIALSRTSGYMDMPLRQTFRKLYAQFWLTTDERKPAVADTYRDALSELEAKSFQYRALGVRLGQWCDILCALGRYDEAIWRLTSACAYAEKVSDWRTLAKNHLRLAVVCARTSPKSDDFRFSVANALRAVQNAHSTQPQLEFDIQRASAELESEHGDLDASRVAIDRARAIVGTYRQRVMGELSADAPGAVDALVPLPALLRKVGLLDEDISRAVLIDSLNLSAFQESLLESSNTLTIMSKRQREMAAYAMYLEHSGWLSAHRVKNMIMGWSYKARGLLEDITREIDNRDVDKMTRMRGLISTGADIEKSVTAIFDEYSTRSIRMEHNWESALDLAGAARDQLSVNITDKAHGTPVIIENCDGCDLDDFRIQASRPMFIYGLWALLDNARRQATICRETDQKVVVVQIGWKSRSRMTGSGVIRVRNSAGDAEKLREAWDAVSVLGSGNRRKSGLSFVFNLLALYSAEVTIACVNGDTVFEVLFPATGSVRPCDGPKTRP